MNKTITSMPDFKKWIIGQLAIQAEARGFLPQKIKRSPEIGGCYRFHLCGHQHVEITFFLTVPSGCQHVVLAANMALLDKKINKFLCTALHMPNDMDNFSNKIGCVTGGNLGYCFGSGYKSWPLVKEDLALDFKNIEEVWVMVDAVVKKWSKLNKIHTIVESSNQQLDLKQRSFDPRNSAMLNWAIGNIVFSKKWLAIVTDFYISETANWPKNPDGTFAHGAYEYETKLINFLKTHIDTPPKELPWQE